MTAHSGVATAAGRSCRSRPRSSGRQPGSAMPCTRPAATASTARRTAATAGPGSPRGTSLVWPRARTPSWRLPPGERPCGRPTARSSRRSPARRTPSCGVRGSPRTARSSVWGRRARPASSCAPSPDGPRRSSCRSVPPIRPTLRSGSAAAMSSWRGGTGLSTRRTAAAPSRPRETTCRRPSPPSAVRASRSCWRRPTVAPSSGAARAVAGTTCRPAPTTGSMASLSSARRSGSVARAAACSCRGTAPRPSRRSQCRSWTPLSSPSGVTPCPWSPSANQAPS